MDSSTEQGEISLDDRILPVGLSLMYKLHFPSNVVVAGIVVVAVVVDDTIFWSVFLLFLSSETFSLQSSSSECISLRGL